METLLYVGLSDGTTVDIHASAPLNAETFEELKSYLEVYERVLRKRAAVLLAAGTNFSDRFAPGRAGG